jgi:hypothetical protein
MLVSTVTTPGLTAWFDNVSAVKREITVPADGVTLSPPSAEISEGGTVILTAAFVPYNATNQTVSFSTSDSGVAEVTQDTTDPMKAAVTAKKPGGAVITVTAAPGNFTAECNVSVLKQEGGEVDFSFDTLSGWNTNITELVENGGFEEDSVWSLNNGGAAGAYTSEKARSGKRSIFIRPVSGTWAAVRDNAEKTVSGGSTYRFSMWAIPNNLNGGNARLSFQILDGARNTVTAENQPVINFTGDSADENTWQNKTADYKIDERGALMRYIAARINYSGTGAYFWADDLSVATIQENDPVNKKTGGASLKVGGYKNIEKDTVYSSLIPLNGGRTYKISVYAKTESACKSGVTVKFYDNAGNITGEKLSPTASHSDWENISYDFTVPEEAVSVSVGMVADGAGFSWFDEGGLSLYPQTPASIEISGNDFIAVPLSGQKSISYTAKVLDQFGAEMPGEAVAVSLENTAPGISFSNNTVTVTPSAASDSGLTVKAVSGNLSALKTVRLVGYTEITVTGSGAIEIPSVTQKTEGFNAVLKARDSNTGTADIIWSVTPSNSGVTIDENGILKILPSSKAGDITVTAVWKEDRAVNGSLKVNLYKNTAGTPSGGGAGGSIPKPSTGGGVPYITGTPATPTNPLPPTQYFTPVGLNDIPENYWAYRPITEFAEKGFINGKSEGIFAPDDYITRAEFVKIAVNGLNIPMSGSYSVFEDVPAGSWANPYISAAYNAKIIQGISPDYFGANENITRQDIAVIIIRAAGYAGISIETGGSPKIFEDIWDISGYALEAVNSLSKANIINGRDNGCFSPFDNATRAEAVKILYGLYIIKYPAETETAPVVQTVTPDAPRPSETNFSNGDISIVSANVPEDWSAQGSDKTECAVDTEVFKDGNSSLRLDGTTAGWRGWRHADFAVIGGVSYKFSVWIKTENLNDAAVYISFGVKDADGEWIVKDNDDTATKVMRDKGGTHDWALVEGTYTVPRDGASISYFTPRMNTKNAGANQRVWFDGFTVEKIN